MIRVSDPIRHHTALASSLHQVRTQGKKKALDKALNWSQSTSSLVVDSPISVIERHKYLMFQPILLMVFVRA